MRTNVRVFLSALAALFVLLPLTSSAQAPNQQFGIGGILSSGRSIAGGVITSDGGGTIYGAYAASPTVHINVGFGLEVINVEDISSTVIQFSASGKFFFGGSGLFHPFASAGFTFSNHSVEGTSLSRPSISAGVGAEYFANRNFGAFINMSVIMVQFGDVSGSVFGIGRPSVGMEWFF